MVRPAVSVKYVLLNMLSNFTEVNWLINKNG